MRLYNYGVNSFYHRLDHCCISLFKGSFSKQGEVEMNTGTVFFRALCYVSIDQVSHEKIADQGIIVNVTGHSSLAQ